MRIKLLHKNDIAETRLDIHYRVIDYQIKQILEIADVSLPVISIQNKNGSDTQIDIADIYYAESVNKELFVYAVNEIYTSEYSLQSMSEHFAVYGLIRINKSIVLNIYHIQSIQLGKQMKYLITLDNGEKVELSRSYREYFFSYINSIYGNEKEKSC